MAENRIQSANERHICRFIRGAPQMLYDIGVGPKSEWKTLGGQYPHMRICGCEPHPGQHRALLQAGFPGPLAQVAIDAVEGVAMLHVPSNDLKCCSLHPVPYADARIQVDVWTLDRFDEEMGMPERILLWMDIEGSELSALRSARRLLQSGRVRWINVEERRGSHRPTSEWCDPSILRAFLAEQGYRLQREYNKHSTHHDVIYIHVDEPSGGPVTTSPSV